MALNAAAPGASAQAGPSAPDAVGDHLDALVARLGARLRRLSACSTRLSRLRLGVVLGGGTLAWLLGHAVAPWAGWLAAALALAAFTGFARLHDRIERARVRTAWWQAVQRRHHARRSRDWEALLGETSTVPAGHPFAADLDVLGPRSVLALLSTAGTQGGHARLRDWLLAAEPSPAAASERQARVRALVGHRAGDRLTLLGHEAAGSLDRRWDDAPLQAWMHAPPLPVALRRWTAALSLLALLMAGLFGAALLGAPSLWGPAWLLYLALYGWQFARTRATFEATHALESTLRHLLPMLRWMETTAPRLPRPLSPLAAAYAGADRPSAFFRALGRLTAATAFTRSDLVRVAVNVVLPYDLLLTMAFARFRGRVAQVLPRWLDALYEFEALSALATHAALHPHSTVFPTLGAAGGAFEAVGLRHPLLPPERTVGNDAVLEPGRVLLISGSNMSGKSTFLRAVGLASVLAWAGGPVPARALTLPPLRPFTSMRVGDVLQEGLSTFYAEVRRLRLLLDAVEAPGSPVLVLIDEMLRGTNNRERLAGSEALACALAGAPAFTCIATHDLDLTRLADADARVHNVHFREATDGGALVFDYTLRQGPCPTTNALVIMRHAGLPVPPAPAGQ